MIVANGDVMNNNFLKNIISIITYNNKTVILMNIFLKLRLWLRLFRGTYFLTRKNIYRNDIIANTFIVHIKDIGT